MRNRRSVSALSAGSYTTTLLVVVDRVKGGGRATPHPMIKMYDRKWPLPVYLLYSLVFGRWVRRWRNEIPIQMFKDDICLGLLLLNSLFFRISGRFF
jgi:hypothetical protein